MNARKIAFAKAPAGSPRRSCACNSITTRLRSHDRLRRSDGGASISGCDEEVLSGRPVAWYGPFVAVTTGGTTIGFAEWIHRALARQRSITEFARDLIVAHEEVAPAWDWSRLRQVDFDEVEELRTRWLDPFLESARKSMHTGGLLVGINAPGSDALVFDMYLFSTPSTASSSRFDWPARFTNVYARSRVLERLSRASFEGERCPRHDALDVLSGYAAKLIAVLLADSPSGLGGERERDVFVGHHGGEPLHIGRLDDRGFVPTPPSVAAARLRARRARYVEWVRERNGPEVLDHAEYGSQQEANAYARSFRHPDGRTWEIRALERELQLRFTDSDGDESRRTRPSEDPEWDAQALVRDQLREGFVEVDVAKV